jgi:hypothetical protein
MNSSYGRGFSYGYKHFNSKGFSTFFKQNSNNKNIFNMFNSSTNSQKFRMTFSNKFFMSKAYFLVNHAGLLTSVCLGSKMLSGEVKVANELEQIDKEAIHVGEGMSPVQGLFLVRHGKIFNFYIR